MTQHDLIRHTGTIERPDPGDPFGLDRATFVRLDWIVLDPVTQVRAGGVIPAQVREYEKAMKAGDRFPPVILARDAIDHDASAMRFVLIDGWHRVSAAMMLGHEDIRAEIVEETDPDRFAWLATEANRKHGFRLTKADKRNMFRAYVRAGEHLLGGRAKRARVKPANQMANDLSGIASRNTITEWMRQDFPAIFAKMGNDLGDLDEGRDGPSYREKEAEETAVMLLRQVRAMMPAIKGAWARKRVAEAAIRMAAEFNPDVVVKAASKMTGKGFPQVDDMGDF